VCALDAPVAQLAVFNPPWRLQLRRRSPACLPRQRRPLRHLCRQRRLRPRRRRGAV